ncbi:ClpXP protease specificity-enhancing factor [soil metagenome]
MSEDVSTKPYLIRALYEWCCDCGYTPYIAVAVDERTVVPREFVKNGEIVLNVSPLASNKLQLGNDLVTFHARFGGVAREISVPLGNVISIYARETGHGMAFEVPRPVPAAETNDDVSEPGVPPAARPPADRPVLTSVPTANDDEPEPSGPAPAAPTPIGGGGRPTLKRIK